MARGKKQRRRGTRRENRHEERQKVHAGGSGVATLDIPEGLNVFKPEKDKQYHFDIMPTIVGEKNLSAQPGDEYFELSYPRYNALGIEDKPYVAIGELLGVPDPVAKHFAVLNKQNVDWDDMKEFKPKKRQVWLIFVHEQADKGLQIWESSYQTFGKELDDEMKQMDEPWVDNFDDPDYGATVRVRFRGEDIGQQNPWVKASRVDFIERDGGFDADGDAKLAEKLLDQAAEICLDDMLIIPTYETLEKALNGEPVGGTSARNSGSDTDDADDEKPAKSRGRRKPAKKEPEAEPAEVMDFEPDKDEDDELTATAAGITKGCDVEHEEHGLCVVVRIDKSDTLLTLSDEEEDLHKKVPVDECTLIEDDGADGDDADEEEPAPPPKKKGRAAAGGAGKGRSTGKKANAGAKGAASKSRSKTQAKKEEPADDDWDDDWEDA